jgi:hypothetical protein
MVFSLILLLAGRPVRLLTLASSMMAAASDSLEENRNMVLIKGLV